MVAGFFSFQVSYLGRTRLVALVGRETGVAIVRKLASRAMAETNEAALVAIFEHRCMFKTITFDNGAEFHDDRIIEMIHLVKCNFGAPCHSWERGFKENFNGPLRKYLHKGLCMSMITHADCDEVASRLKMRPRKRWGSVPHARSTIADEGVLHFTCQSALGRKHSSVCAADTLI
jgi:IS30 family transposase